MSDEADSQERYWIAEVPMRAVKTVLIRATSRKEAEMKLRNPLEYPDDVEGVDVSYEVTGYGKVLREDKKR